MGTLIVLIVLGLPQQRDVPDYMNAIVAYRQAGAILRQEPLWSIHWTIQRSYETYNLDLRRMLLPRIVRVHEAVRDGNKRPYAVERIDPYDSTVGFPDSLNQKEVAKALVSYAQVLMADGKTNKAFEVLMDVDVMADRIGFSATLIPYLVAGAMQSMSRWEINSNLQRMSLPAAEHILANVTPPESHNDDMKSVILRESQYGRAKSLALLSTMYTSRADFIADLTDEFGRPPTSQEVDSALREFEEMKSALQRPNPLIREMAAIIDMPESEWWQASSRIADLAIDEDSVDDSEIKLAFQFYQSLLRNRAITRLLRLHAHITRYYWLNGRLPDDLGQLDQRADATDPLSGEFFKYEPRGEKYDLYSLGTGSTGLIALVRGPNAGFPTSPDDPSVREEN